MGRILPFPRRFLPKYPEAASALDPAECLLLAALRWWLAAIRQAKDPLVWLRQTMAAAGAPDAAHSVDQLMRVVARTARRQVEIGCPCCLGLSRDERRLLHAASLAQAGETARAEEVLRAGMLSAVGAEFALGPLEGLGELLASAGFIFPRRSVPEDLDLFGGDLEAWAPPIPMLLH